jgi:hypothetical protein
MKLTRKQKALLASYARSILSGFLTLLLLGVNDMRDIWAAFVAAAVPVLLRALNKKDTLNNSLPTAEETQAVVDNAVAAALIAAQKDAAAAAVKAVKAEPAKAKVAKKPTV